MPIKKENYLSNLYGFELEYINRIMLFQDHYYSTKGEIIILLDKDFPDFKNLTDKKIDDIIFLYENFGWKVRMEKLNERKEFLLILS